MKNSIFARFARAFSSFDILKTFSFFLWGEITFFAVVWTTWAYGYKCWILSCPKRWVQFNSRIVKAHFSGIMTLKNWKMIAETNGQFLHGPGLTWQTIWLARRSALDGAGIMGAYLALTFNTHISFQSCNRHSTIDIRRSPRQHFLK